MKENCQDVMQTTIDVLQRKMNRTEEKLERANVVLIDNFFNSACLLAETAPKYHKYFKQLIVTYIGSDYQIEE